MFLISESPAHAAAATAVAARPVRKRWWRRGPWAPYLYVLPALVLLATWIYKPLVQTVELSFYRWNLIPTTPKTFVGLENYARVLSDDHVGKAVSNTLLYIGAALVCSVVLPLVIALVANSVSGRWRTFYQALIFVPVLVTPVATAAVWRWLFNGDHGAIPIVVRHLFGVEMGDVLVSRDGAIIAIIVIVGWSMLGFGVLVVAAGIAGISPDYAQAAATEGAGAWTVVRRITLPLLSPTIVFLLLMTVLLAAQWSYPVIDILTQGGPVGSTTNVYYLLYELGFANFDSGMSGAAGTLFFIVFGLIALGLVHLSEKVAFYDN